MAKIVNSWDEWSPLKRVILGRPEGTQVPGWEPGIYSHQPEGGFPHGAYGMYPEEMVDEAGEQMDHFARVLTDRGITVDRVEVHPSYLCPTGNGTPDWTLPNMRTANNPRDLFMTVGNEIIEAAGALRARWFEHLNMRPLFERYFREDPDCLWTAAPKPVMTDESYDTMWFHNYYNEWTDDDRRKHMEESSFALTEKEPMWDAACCMRMGRDILFYHSAMVNNAGIDWLRRYFGARGIRIHEEQFGTTADTFYAYHIDVIICPVRPGLLLHNPDRPFLSQKAIDFFNQNDWEIVEAVGPTHDYRPILDGFGVPHNGPSSIFFNTLSLGPNTICVEAHEERYMEQLDKLGIEVIPIPYDKVVPFGGSLHCTTVDVCREGDCEDYFPRQIDGF